MATTKAPTLTLELTRARIADLRRQIAAVEEAGLPTSIVENTLRESLAEAEEAFRRAIRTAAQHLHAGEPVRLSDLIGGSRHETVVPVALGAALAAYGVDKFVADAVKHAESLPKSDMVRLTAAEREAKLTELKTELYSLELIDCGFVEDGLAAYRADTNTAAALGIPVEVAVEHELV